MSQRNFFELYHQSITQPELFWGQQATKYLDWDNSWDRVLTGNFNQKNIRWFTGGYLNACFNCLDRHLLKHAEKPAIIWESDNSLRSKILNYRELFLEVCRFANVLLDKGIKKGDRVCIYLPMIPETIIAVLACARIGAVHSVVFAGFSALALQNRILDADCHLVITADGGNRGGKFIPLKSNVDEALLNCPKVKTVIVVKHTNQPIPWFNQRDFCWSELVEASSLECFPAIMEATSPLFILYTSGSTGKPKGILHATAGYLLHTAISFDWVFNYQLGEVFWCTADVGWITGHSYVIYGPLLNGATLVLYEGVPNFPTFSRYWEIIDKYRVNIFYTAPTAIRSLMGEGDHHLANTSRNSLRLLGTVGEPINPEAWRWYYEVVGKRQCPIVDTWWQTETGGIMLTPILEDTHPILKDSHSTLAIFEDSHSKLGSVGHPFFGIVPGIMDSEKKILLQGEAEGDLVITQPWPGMLQGIYKNFEKFASAYFEKYPNYYFTGDGAYRDPEGNYWIRGRVDDVLNVSGHRIGTAEVESSLVAHPKVVEAAVVDFPDIVKGQGIYAFVTLIKSEIGNEDLEKELKLFVRKGISAIAVPQKIHWVNELPKTRSGKIMRRLLRKIAHNDLEDFGDLSTLANPEVLQDIIKK